MNNLLKSFFITLSVIVCSLVIATVLSILLEVSGILFIAALVVPYFFFIWWGIYSDISR